MGALAYWCSSLQVYFALKIVTARCYMKLKLFVFVHKMLKQIEQYLIVERERYIQLVLSVEHISHVKISTRCSDVICTMYS